MLHKKRKLSTFTSSSSRDVAAENMLHSKSTYFYRWGSLIPTCCGIALLLGVGMIINPVVREVEKANAATTNIVTNDTLGTKVDLIMGDVLNTSETVQSGEVAFISNNFQIKVEGRADYHISVQAAEGYGSELVGREYKEQIVGVGANVSPDSFDNNTWGYSLVSNGTVGGDVVTTDPTEVRTYNTLPAYGTLTAPIHSVADAQDQTDIYDLIFAAKITSYKPSDHYETAALLSVVAEPKEVVKTMQAFAKVGSCSSLTDQIQLMDARDNKIYWVGKVNGQCIMTQNLDFDIPGGTLSKDQTDIEVDWTGAKATKTGTSWSWVSSDYDVVQSYDPGSYYLNQATSSWAACGATKNPDACNRYTAFASSVNRDTVHYAVGNYYSYIAATAGSGLSVGSRQNAPDSICPKGWKLFDNTGEKSLRAVMIGATADTIRQAPYFLTSAGRAIGDGLSDVGSTGFYWTSTRYSGTDAYLYVYRSGDNSTVLANQDTNVARFVGYPVRCVVK